MAGAGSELTDREDQGDELAARPKQLLHLGGPAGPGVRVNRAEELFARMRNTTMSMSHEPPAGPRRRCPGSTRLVVAGALSATTTRRGVPRCGADYRGRRPHGCKGPLYHCATRLTGHRSSHQQPTHPHWVVAMETPTVGRDTSPGTVRLSRGLAPGGRREWGEVGVPAPKREGVCPKRDDIFSSGSSCRTNGRWWLVVTPWMARVYVLRRRGLDGARMYVWVCRRSTSLMVN